MLTILFNQDDGGAVLPPRKVNLRMVVDGGTVGLDMVRPRRTSSVAVELLVALAAVAGVVLAVSKVVS